MDNITLVKGDITKLDTDAIVNAANTSLMGGGGVDGAIHRAGGKQILEECRAIVARQGGCATGNAVITSGGLMKAKHVIHTVGPVWREGVNNEQEMLANCYKNSLQLAIKNSIHTIAFPNISTGIYGFPKARAAKIAVKTVKTFLDANPEIEQVVFCCFDEENYEIYKEQLEM